MNLPYQLKTSDLNNERTYLIWKIEKDWPALRYGLKNGRRLNRLSTKQLHAKLALCEKILREQRKNYVESIFTFA